MAIKLKKVAPATTTESDPAPKVDAKAERSKAGMAKHLKEHGLEGDTKPVKASKNRGRTTGLPIMQYQDQTMANQAKAMLTDEELGANWAEEFPEARCQFAERMDIVRTVRRLFNEKRHGNQQIFTDTPVLRYGLEGKKRVVIAEETRGKRPGAAEVEEEVEAPAPVAKKVKK